MVKASFVIGNWKMHKTIPETERYIETLIRLLHNVDVLVGLSVPFTALSAAKQSVAKERMKGDAILVGGQDISAHHEGAYTGEISGVQLKDAGAAFVLIGHSERRQYHYEAHLSIKSKIHQALKAGIRPVLCVGETDEERGKGLTETILKMQIASVLEGFTSQQASELVLAYEPVWAIGTGKTATADMAQSMHEFCRKCLGKLFTDHVASKIPILYGGSVKTDNIASLMKEKDINGALVGGASLDVDEFAKIIHLSRN